VTRIRKFAASVVVTSLLGIAGTAVSVVPAQAAGCTGFSCAGHDPNVEACSVASTTTSSSSLAVVQNRFSQNCRSNWVRGELTQQGFNNGDSIIIFIQTTDSRGNFESQCYPGPNNTGHLIENCSGATYRSTSFAFSDMVDGTNVTAAILDVFDSSGNLIQQLETDQ